MAQVRFNFMYGPGVQKTGQDLSRTKEDVFEELPPFAMDSEGNFLNKSSQPKIVNLLSNKNHYLIHEIIN